MTEDNRNSGPAHLDVLKYFFRMGLEEKHADAFYYYYSLQHWEVKPGHPVKNWKSLAFNWVCSFSKAKPILKIGIYCRD